MIYLWKVLSTETSGQAYTLSFLFIHTL